MKWISIAVTHQIEDKEFQYVPCFVSSKSRWKTSPSKMFSRSSIQRKSKQSKRFHLLSIQPRNTFHLELQCQLQAQDNLSSISTSF